MHGPEYSRKIMLPSVDRWAALRTSARWEKQLAASLNAAGVATFLPTVTRQNHHKGRTTVSEIPLFLGYVFCSETAFLGNPAVPAAVRKKVAQILRTPDQELLQAELNTIAELTASHRLVQERVYGKAGDRVRVIRGVLAGTEGEISRHRPGRQKISLRVSLIGGEVEIEVDEATLEKI
jgi:transcription antitermination factor NusG